MKVSEVFVIRALLRGISILACPLRRSAVPFNSAAKHVSMSSSSGSEEGPPFFRFGSPIPSSHGPSDKHAKMSSGSGIPTGTDHPGVTLADWTSKGKVDEMLWIRDQEKQDRDSLLKHQLTELEGQLEDILVDEFITESTKGRLMDWKIKMFVCLGKSGESPLEKVIVAQSAQAHALSELESLLESENADLSLHCKHHLVDWYMKGQKI